MRRFAGVPSVVIGLLAFVILVEGTGPFPMGFFTCNSFTRPEPIIDSFLLTSESWKKLCGQSQLPIGKAHSLWELLGWRFSKKNSDFRRFSWNYYRHIVGSWSSNWRKRGNLFNCWISTTRTTNLARYKQHFL